MAAAAPVWDMAGGGSSCSGNIPHPHPSAHFHPGECAAAAVTETHFN